MRSIPQKYTCVRTSVCSCADGHCFCITIPGNLHSSHLRLSHLQVHSLEHVPLGMGLSA